MGVDVAGAGGSAPGGSSSGAGQQSAAFDYQNQTPSGFDFGFGQSPPVMQPHEQAPNRPPGVEVPPAQQGPGQSVRNAFMPATFVAPYYNAAATAGNLGTMQTAGVAPAAAQWQQQLFNPNLNTMEQSFMGAGLANASRALEQGMLRQEAEFENTPFHSALPKAQGDVMSQVADSLIGQGAQLGLNRQQLASQQAQFPFTYGLQAAQVGPNMSERYYNLLNNAFSQYMQQPMQAYTQLPIPSPVITTGGGGGGKLG